MLDSRIGKDIDEFQQKYNRQYYDMQKVLNEQQNITNDRAQIDPYSRDIMQDLATISEIFSGESKNVSGDALAEVLNKTETML